MKFSYNMMVGASSLVIAFSNPAIAQDSPSVGAADDSNDGIIIVTAQRRSERLQDVPVSVSVVDGSVLAKQNIATLDSVSNRQPAVVIRSAPGGDQIAVRGTSSGFNAGFEQSVATFVDGVYRSRSRSSRLALFDIDRVEILRGPQTTFFGANAIAGALNITTRKPGDSFGGKILGFYSPDDNEYALEASVDTPLSESAGLRFAGRITGMDAIARNERLDQRGNQRSRQFRISGRAELSESVRVDARFDYSRIKDTGANALEIVGCPPQDLAPASLCARSIAEFGTIDNVEDRRYDSAYLDTILVELYEAAATATAELGPVDLIITTAYSDQKADLQLEQANFPVDSVLGVGSLLPASTTEDYNQFSQEIRLQSNNDGPLNYTVGGYYERSNLDTGGAIGYFQGRIGALAAPNFSANDLVVVASTASQQGTTWSGFGSVSYDITEKLKFSTGLRYSHVRKDATRSSFIGTINPYPDGTAPPLFDAVPGNAAGQATLANVLSVSLDQFAITRRNDDEWMPSANLIYKITPDAMVYASYAHGFKAGGYNLSRSADIFDPEKADSYEIGAKTSWLDRRLTLNLTLFRVDYSNLQESGVLYTPSGASLSYIGNVAQSRAKGVELEMSARPFDGFRISAGLAYLESKYLKYLNAPCSPYQSALAAQPGSSLTCPQDLSGITRSNAPKWSGSVAADYTSEVGDGLEFGIGGTVYFRSKYFMQALPEELTSQDGFAKVDLRASLRGTETGWGASLIVQNLFDKDTSTFAGHAPTAPGTTQRIADRGRVIGLQLSYNFGGEK